MVEEKENNSFWNTLLGTITKITSLLVAITGLMLAIGPFLKSCNNIKPNNNLEPTATSPMEKDNGEKAKTGNKAKDAEYKMNHGGSSVDR